MGEDGTGTFCKGDREQGSFGNSHESTVTDLSANNFEKYGMKNRLKHDLSILIV
jgi:hypothetical protein